MRLPPTARVTLGSLYIHGDSFRYRRRCALPQEKGPGGQRWGLLPALQRTCCAPRVRVCRCALQSA